MDMVQIMSENTSILEEIDGSIMQVFPNDASYAFLAGAGISMAPPSSLPSARAMCRMLLEFCAPGEEVDALIALQGLRYEQLVEEVQNQVDKELAFLEYLDIAPMPNINHLLLASMMVAGHPVITTNFDCLIEEAARAILPQDKQALLQIIITKENFKAAQLPAGTPSCTICKLHGSVKNALSNEDTRASLVTTMAALGRDRAHGETFSIEPFKKPAIIAAISGRVLVVLGYSGRDDFDIVPLLREFSSMKGIIWIEHDESIENPQVFHVRESDQAGDPATPPHIRLLANLAGRGASVSLIKGNTSTVISQLQSLMKIPSPPETSDSVGSRPSFTEWAAPIFDAVTPQQKEKLASALYHGHGKLQDAFRCASRGLEAATLAGEDRDITWFLNEQGIILETTGDLDGSLQCFEQALVIDEKGGDIGGQATRLGNIGALFQTKGKLDVALKYYKEVLAIAERVGEMRGKADVLDNIATVLFMQGEIVDAQKYIEQALAIDEKLGNLSKKAGRLINLGFVLKDRGDVNMSLNYFQQALAISEQLDDQLNKAISMNNIGLIQQMKGDPNGAMQSFEAAYKIHDALGDLSRKAVTLNNIGALLRIHGELEKALQFHEQALAINKQLDDKISIAGDLSSIGQVFMSAGKLDETMQYYKKALALCEETGDLHGKASKLNNIGAVLFHQKDFDGALDCFQQVLAIDEKLGNLSGKTSDLNNIGFMLKKRGEVDGALKCFEESLEISDKTGNLNDRASSLNNLGSLLQDKGDFDGALKHYEEALLVDEKTGDIEEKANQLNNIGNLFEQQGKLQEALEKYQLALETCEAAGLKRTAETIWKNLQAVKLRIQFGLL